MVKNLFVILFVLVSFLSNAQVTINVQLPAAGMVYKDQLWNLVLASNNSGIAETSISLELQDAVTGQPVLSATSRNFMLGKGVKNISIKDVQPVQYNYLTSELTGKYLPLGSYVACYRLIKKDDKVPTPLGDECTTIHIAPLTPPILNTPEDRTVLETNYPLFTWLPPGPVNMFDNLNYDFVIAEVLPGQSTAEAILYNTPIFTSKNLRVATQSYPASFSRLKEGQQYAWQVTARNGLNYSAQTEAWTFTIKSPDSATVTVASAGYIQLVNNKESSGISSIRDNELLVKYYSFEKDHETTVKFFAADNKLLRRMKHKIKYGDNFLKFSLNKDFKKGIVYRISIDDQQNNTYSANFIIQ
jgi:hypothetical protein